MYKEKNKVLDNEIGLHLEALEIIYGEVLDMLNG